MIIFAIVLYDKLLSDSETANYFENKARQRLLKDNCQIVVYDNSANRQDLPLQYHAMIASYVHDHSNGGVASAYNYCLSLSRGADDWLVLLDQDSSLPDNYIDEITRLADEVRHDETIAAVAPHVLCNNAIISPCRKYLGGVLRPVEIKFTGKHNSEIRAINSGMMVRASFMNRIGGFNQLFWLDYLDHWLCRTIYGQGKMIFVSRAVMNHHLSVCNYNQMSERRALNILHSELIFYKKYMPWYEQKFYVFRLLYRALKQLLTVHDKRIALNTMRAIPQIFRKQ